MKAYYPTKEIEEENDRLVSLFLSLDEELSIDQFVEVYASQDYKDYLREKEKRDRKLLAQGIIEN